MGQARSSHVVAVVAILLAALRLSVAEMVDPSLSEPQTYPADDGEATNVAGQNSPLDIPDGATIAQEFEAAGAKLRDDPLAGTPDVLNMPDGMSIVKDTNSRNNDKMRSQVHENIDNMPDGAAIADLSRKETDKSTPMGIPAVVGSSSDMPDGSHVMEGVSLLRGDGGALRVAVASSSSSFSTDSTAAA